MHGAAGNACNVTSCCSCCGRLGKPHFPTCCGLQAAPLTLIEAGTELQDGTDWSILQPALLLPLGGIILLKLIPVRVIVLIIVIILRHF